MKGDSNLLENLLCHFLEEFPHFSRKSLIKLIEENKYDKEKIHKTLESINRRSILKDLKLKFEKELTEEEIEECAKISNYKLNKALQNCKERVEKKSYKMEGKGEKEYVICHKMEEKCENIDEIVQNQEISKQGAEVDKMLVKVEVRRVVGERERDQERSVEEIMRQMRSVGNEDKRVLTLRGNREKYVLRINYPEKTNYSWIGFYKFGDENKNYRFSHYLSTLNDGFLVCDKPYLNGVYEFRVFKSYSYVSSTYELVSFVEDKVENKNFVTLEIDQSDTYWINIHFGIASFDLVSAGAFLTVHKEEETRVDHYRRKEYLKSQTGTLRLKKPVHDGVYEARIYVPGEETYREKSNVVEII